MILKTSRQKTVAVFVVIALMAIIYFAGETAFVGSLNALKVFRVFGVLLLASSAVWLASYLWTKQRKAIFAAILFVLVMIGLGTAMVSVQYASFTPQCSGTNDTSAFSAIISVIGSRTGSIKIPWVLGTRCALSNLTIPSNIALDFSNATGVKVNTGQTVIDLGGELGPIQQRFFNALPGQGTWLFHTSPIIADGQTNVFQVYPQWWGAVANYATDCSPAITAAINSGARKIFLPAGGYGLASPVVITANNFILEGQSRVYTDIFALAVDIHVGSGPNALFVNSQNATNAVICNIRFTSVGAPFTGWAIWAEDGVQGGEALFSTIIRDCWIQMGTNAQGFFHGGASDCFFDNLDVEFTAFVFHLKGAGISADTFSNIHVLFDVEPIIYCVTDPSNIMHVRGLLVTAHLQETVIYVTNGTDWDFSDVIMDYDPVGGGLGATTAGGLAQFDSCTRLLFSSFSARRISGNMGGILLKDTTGKISQGYIYDPRPVTAIPQALRVSGVSDIDIDNVSVDLGTVSHLGITGSGNVRVNNCRFTRSTLAEVINSMPTMANITIQNSHILNANYNFASLSPVMDISTSGRFIARGNTIGVDDVLAVPTAIFEFTGAGSAVVDNNQYVGALAFTVGAGSTQPVFTTTLYQAAMPTVGAYAAGSKVWASAPAEAGGGGSKYIIEGWNRLTTGSNNVLNTDWMQRRVLTGN